MLLCYGFRKEKCCLFKIKVNKYKHEEAGSTSIPKKKRKLSKIYTVILPSFEVGSLVQTGGLSQERS